MTPLGYLHLIDRFQLKAPPLRQVSCLSPVSGLMRHKVEADGTERIEMPRNRAAAHDNLASALTFALKREHLNLTVLAALFEHETALAELRQWLADAPTSTYSRQAAYLAKWLNGIVFDYSLPPGSPRVRILNEKKYIVGPSVSDAQFGVVNNLLGTPAFCPLVRRTERLETLLQKNLKDKITAAIAQLEPEVLARAIDYLYLAETRSTYSIEKEVPTAQRTEKFRRLLESAGEPGPLTEEQICTWQNSIVSEYVAEASFRTTQNWLSRPGRLRNVADFIPPAPADVGPMMEGVAKLAKLGADNAIDPAIAATCAAFGLVFVHPFRDGNGRLHRFLLHHVLRQAGYTPPGVVLPLSARMLHAMGTYSELLKAYSAPRTRLIEYVLDDDSQTISIRSPQPTWLYASFDATPLCEFILECIEQCVEEDLAKEVQYLLAYDKSLARLETWLDLPQPELSLLVRLIVQGNGELSKSKQKHFKHIPQNILKTAETVVADEFSDYIDALAGRE